MYAIALELEYIRSLRPFIRCQAGHVCYSVRIGITIIFELFHKVSGR